MKKEYTEQEYRRILGGKVTESEAVSGRIEETYAFLRKNAGLTGQDGQRKGRLGKRSLQRLWIAASGVAAVFATILCVGVANPALAAKIPLIGGIFRSVEEKVSYPGDYSRHAEPLAPDARQEAGTKDIPYEQESGGVTVTVSEYYADSVSLYLAVKIEPKNGFPEEMMRETKADTQEYRSLQLESRAVMDLSAAGLGKISFEPAMGCRAVDLVEGNFVNDHCFEGIVRIALEDVKGCDENGDMVEISQLPEHFIYDLRINGIYVTRSVTDEVIKLEGDWAFSLDVTPDDSETVVKEVGLVGECGVGIASVTKSRYDLFAKLILPEDAEEGDYTVVVTDEKGNLLQGRYGYGDIYNVYQKDIGKVTVAVCDYLTWADHRSDAAYLLSHALLKTEVDFEK